MPGAGRDDSIWRGSSHLAAAAEACALGRPSPRPPALTTLICWTVRTSKPYDNRGRRPVATERGVMHVARRARRSDLDPGGTIWQRMPR
jgi:hypothetical protein